MMAARNLRQLPSVWGEDEDSRPSGVHPIARSTSDESVERGSQRPTQPVLRNAAPGLTPDIYTKIESGTLANVDVPGPASSRPKRRKQPGARRITRDLFLSLGSLHQTPRRTCLAVDLRNAAIDPRQAFVLSLVDGMTPIESIVDVCPLPMHQVLVILENLLSLRLLTFD